VTTGTPIPDCGIEILDENKEILFKGRTDKDGKVIFIDLPYGNYFYREFDAPEGYIIDETPFPFEIKENGKIIKATMTNTPIPDEKPDQPTPGETPDEPTPGETPDEPTPGETPDEPAPGEIPDEPTPGYVERTGDNTNIPAVAFVVGVSFVIIGLALFFKKKKTSE
jgi:hypothetical protein